MDTLPIIGLVIVVAVIGWAIWKMVTGRGSGGDGVGH